MLLDRAVYAHNMRGRLVLTSNETSDVQVLLSVHTVAFIRENYVRTV